MELPWVAEKQPDMDILYHPREERTLEKAGDAYLCALSFWNTPELSNGRNRNL